MTQVTRKSGPRNLEKTKNPSRNHSFYKVTQVQSKSWYRGHYLTPLVKTMVITHIAIRQVWKNMY